MPNSETVFVTTYSDSGTETDVFIRINKTQEEAIVLARANIDEALEEYSELFDNLTIVSNENNVEAKATTISVVDLRRKIGAVFETYTITEEELGD